MLDKFADGAAAGVNALTNAIERRALRRRVTDEDQRIELLEFRKAGGKLGLAVFTRRIERRGAGVAEAGNVMTSDLECLAMKILQAELRAEGGDLLVRFVIAGDDVHLPGALSQDSSAGIEAAAPVDQVAGRKITVGVDGHEAFERRVIAVNVGENQDLHSSIIEGSDFGARQRGLV